MGERRREAFRVGFDRSVKLELRGAPITSDEGLLAFRELDEALGLTQVAGEARVDTRTGQNTRHGLIAQLRPAVYSRLAHFLVRNANAGPQVQQTIKTMMVSESNMRVRQRLMQGRR